MQNFRRSQASDSSLSPKGDIQEACGESSGGGPCNLAQKAIRPAITKKDWLEGQACRAKAWYELRTPPAALSEADLFRMQQGQEIGLLAQKLFPEGILIPRIPGVDPSKVTEAFVANCAREIFFEATVRAGAFVAKADIIGRMEAGWHILEVKSSFPDTDHLERLVDDLAYTVMVFCRAGLPVAKASLVLLSRSYRLGGPLGTLFEVIDQTHDAVPRAAEFDRKADSYAGMIFDIASPPVVLNPECRNCRFFADTCIGKDSPHTVLELPRLTRRKLSSLWDLGAVDLLAIPPDFPLSERQERVRRTVSSQSLFVGQGLRAALDAIVWPCHYLDFETVTTMLPLYPGHGCHQHVLTQFSLHRRASPVSEATHSEYLADETKDCERELTEALVRFLDGPGTIMVYSAFERVRIRALSDQFPDLTVILDAIRDRLVDLLPIVSSHVYHADFRGSFSIKTVLPVLVPDLSYDGMSIADGGTAIARFARLARGGTPGAERLQIRKQILDYCRLDTLAMVRIHDALLDLSELRIAPARH